MALWKKNLAILVILSLALGEIFRLPLDFLGVRAAAISPTDILVFILVILGISSSGKKFFKAKLARPILIFFCVGLLSLLVNIHNLLLNEVIVSSFYLFRWIIFAGIYFVICKFDLKTKKTFSFVLVFTGFVVAVLGFLQYFFYPDLRNIYYAGWDEHLYRLFSTFLDPNFVGTILVLSFILSLGLLFKEKSFTKIKFMISAISIFAAILLTYSRSAFLMFIVSTASLLFLLNKKKLFFGILILTTIGILLLPKNLKSEGVNLFRTASIAARGDSAKNALTIFHDNPIFGIGFDSYRYAQMRYGFIKREAVHSGAGTDNSFLFVLATTGIVGFISFLYLWSKISKNTIENHSLISYIVIVSIIGLFVDSLFINSLFYEKIMLWMWVLLGIMENK